MDGRAIAGEEGRCTGRTVEVTEPLAASAEGTGMGRTALTEG